MIKSRKPRIIAKFFQQLIRQVELEIDSLSPNERIAMKNLSNYKNITISKADKGNAIVILNKMITPGKEKKS